MYPILPYIFIFFGFLALQSCDNFNEGTATGPLPVTNDSISSWIKASKNESYPTAKRKRFLSDSYNALQTLKTDTAKVRHLSSIAYQSYKLGDTLMFKKLNDEALDMAHKIKDSFAVGDLHWNYASYYNKKEVYDSAYYHFNIAHTHFEQSGYVFESATTLYGMAFIKGRFRDYSGSEDLIFRAISMFEDINAYKSLYSCYDFLGQLQIDIYEYDQALLYYTKSIEYANKIDGNGYLYEVSQNNIGNVSFP